MSSTWGRVQEAHFVTVCRGALLYTQWHSFYYNVPFFPLKKKSHEFAADLIFVYFLS